MDPNFKKQLAREVEAKVQSDILDPIQKSHQGRPVSEIKTALESEFKRIGGTIPEADLDKYATAISQGKPVRAKGIVR